MLEIRALTCAGSPQQLQNSDFSERERKIDRIELAASAFVIQNRRLIPPGEKCGLGPHAAPTAALAEPGRRAVFTTHLPAGHPVRAVASLRVRSAQLTRLDSHQLGCSLVGC